jgi:hypothetical protein
MLGYGGFNISLTPSFSIANAVWMENGGVYAYLTYERRRIWKKCRNQNAKQNVFDDFIAAAEYLIAQIYFFRFPCHSWWVKWRFTSRGNDDTASRIDESGFAGSRSNGHVALPYFYGRCRLGI